jgi:hypothetical protein
MLVRWAQRRPWMRRELRSIRSTEVVAEVRARFWLTRVALVLAIVHFPALVIRLSWFAGGNGPWMEILILAGPTTCLLGMLVSLWPRRSAVELFTNALLLFGYILAYLTIWLAAGRPEVFFR